MPHDPILVLETKGWLKKAAIDIRSAEHAFTAIPPILSEEHAQEESEEALQVAKKIYRDILKRLPEEVHPG
jgi:hypothetical protein